ncbi:protein phosphatase 2C, putative [Phytophthora infestans T30-4]|uniref:Protein phosphatase 2C, putative n=1 Tax=Phytophthora infestans (strain T30-4) TaxID=403677 RepID=D0RLS6_PHYIT|nr:protein phosphatase 2C, putative [Phytophthora infestans T30-4]EEY68901.1 protein phosphatase 2C, putative [Phytophthora infestans T30-4]|eukprot:XP_002999332.1 protein phosphatase 2C, putative [Phytophthora infestans T30-4]
MKQLLQPISFSGAASVFVDELDEEDQPTRLYVANVGDCRAVLCTADALAVDMTTDHKASLPAEQERIEASGGFVHNGRLDGILQISRGFGDLAHKQDGHLVVTPDVVEHLVNPSDQFLLLASDGLFDVLTSQQAVNFVLRKLQTHGDVQLAAQELVLKAQAYFAHDNISVVIVALNQKGDA